MATRTGELTERLVALRRHAATKEATVDSVAALVNDLAGVEWDRVLEETADLVPLPNDGRGQLGLGDGGDGWSVLWWDREGRRVVGRQGFLPDAEAWSAVADREPCAA